MIHSINIYKWPSSLVGSEDFALNPPCKVPDFLELTLYRVQTGEKQINKKISVVIRRVTI